MGAIQFVPDFGSTLMSGPTTAVFVADPVSVMVAAAAIRAAQAVAEGYDAAADLHGEHQAQRSQLQQELQQASARGKAALQQEAAAVDAEFSSLSRLAQRYVAADKLLAARPHSPDPQNELQQAAYVRAMRQLLQELRTVLLNESARHLDDLGPELYLQDAITRAAATQQTTVQRLLARIAHLGELPPHFVRLAKEIDDQPFADSERARLLLSELRLQIQQRVETAQAHAVQEASALILQQSLKDLGYQVEEVSSTLFVEGGVVHFRRQGWENYMVRMRIDAKANTANFNVIRAVEGASNERSVLDHLAEDRWCAEFPALLQALAARGLNLNVTRRLQAGELPVQQVESHKLPCFSDEESASQRSQLKSRELK